MRRFISKNRNQVIITALLLILWLSFTWAAPKTFLSSAIYISFMSTIPFIAIVSLGMTLVLVCGEMDLSFASNMAMSGFVFAVVTQASGHPLFGFMAALLCGTAIGFINGFIITTTGVPAIVATIGADFFWRGTVMLLSGGLALSLSFIRKMPETQIFVGRIFGIVPAQAVWCLLVAAAMAMILHRRPWGDNLRFIGDNAEAARMMGIDVEKSRVKVFALLGFTAALSGSLATMEMASWWPTQGEGYLLLVFASVFLGGSSVHGGQGTIWGTLVASIIIGMIEAALVSAGWSGFWTRFIHGLVLIGSVSFYSLAARKKN